MFLSLVMVSFSSSGFPRVRGDVPASRGDVETITLFSPRARGCSFSITKSDFEALVFPACAGMFPLRVVMWKLSHCFPRVRGDVPFLSPNPILRHLFSPRARGCSQAAQGVQWRQSVFPACAGMFLFAFRLEIVLGCFPRVRGDVPTPPPKLCLGTRFSPRARGCSDQVLPMIEHGRVFPACAGMFRRPRPCPSRPAGFPRVRGDVPASRVSIAEPFWFSPRARGCSPLCATGHIQTLVFPACAGMFRNHPGRRHSGIGFPRVRGDVPQRTGSPGKSTPFSPRARGCSAPTNQTVQPGVVFPACAGMFRKARFITGNSSGFPRVRGDVPVYFECAQCVLLFSPRARGCSQQAVREGGLERVFPACAGMFRLTATPPWGRTRFPRVRGDVPLGSPAVVRAPRFSPRARGCSYKAASDPLSTTVFPACAGMFPAGDSSYMTSKRFPRVRGDVPSAVSIMSTMLPFSPRARGCSPCKLPCGIHHAVFPACAGMFPSLFFKVLLITCFPRVRGDVPPRSGWLAI